jgi:hypothetical protein
VRNQCKPRPHEMSGSHPCVGSVANATLVARVVMERALVPKNNIGIGDVRAAGDIGRQSSGGKLPALIRGHPKIVLDERLRTLGQPSAHDERQQRYSDWSPLAFFRLGLLTARPSCLRTSQIKPWAFVTRVARQDWDDEWFAFYPVRRSNVISIDAGPERLLDRRVAAREIPCGVQVVRVNGTKVGAISSTYKTRFSAGETVTRRVTFACVSSSRASTVVVGGFARSPVR